MPRTILFALILALTPSLLMPAESPAEKSRPDARQVLVIAHRGASAFLPEHTLAAYSRAIADGADLIEPDLVMTRDAVLVARHENEIGGTTDVADRPEFADRRTRKRIDGREMQGWFTEDFTLAELRTLCARERLPQLRSTRHDGTFAIPTLGEIIERVSADAAKAGRDVGIAPELKHSTHFRGIGLPMEDALLKDLESHAYTRRAPVWIQSFEVGNLEYLRTRIGERGQGNLRLLQLLGSPDEGPADQSTEDGAVSYAAMESPKGLQRIVQYADGIGPHSTRIIPTLADGTLGQPTVLVRDAHAAGLEVLAYTFRPENHFLPRALWQGGNPRARNEAGSIAEIRAHIDAGIDGFFTDDPAVGRSAVQRR